MKFNYICCFFVPAIAGVLLLAGCSSQSTLSTVPVKGLITLDGKPVDGATITFTPIGGVGMSATGRSDAEGIYYLTAVGDGTSVGKANAGTLPGEYKVGISKATAPSYVSAEEAEASGDTVASTAGKNPDVTFLVPKKYRNPELSGLKVTVVDGENNLPFELTSK